MDLVGVDVGFSATRRSSGVVRFRQGNLRLGRATSAWTSRAEILGSDGYADVAAIDAPLLPDLHWKPRSCERLFTFGAYQRRCKPGLSHIPGTGQQLREEGHSTADQLLRIVAGTATAAEFPRVLPERNIVEAFPNAFLGVVVPRDRYDEMPRLRRGKKFDWLYDQWRDSDLFRPMAIDLDPTGALLREFQDCTDHDERAALVCLLTAMAVGSGHYTAIGDQNGGYFFLPRLSDWATWAIDQLEKHRSRLPELEIWMDGESIPGSQSLPHFAYPQARR